MSFIRILAICGKETRNERLNKRDYGVKRAVCERLGEVFDQGNDRRCWGRTRAGLPIRGAVRGAEPAHKAEAETFFPADDK